MSESKILVPIKIEALVVDQSTSRESNWKSFLVDYETLPARMGTQLEPGDMSQVRAGLCEPGVHLHWALPAALTNGIHIGDKVVFPAVPNRWLIIRTQLVGGKAITRKWIIESDYINDRAPRGRSQWAVQNSDGSVSNSFIGRQWELADWTQESRRSDVPLTAVAPGNAAFAAIYQCCRSVFGFYDAMTGIEKGTFSYMVTGWYSDPLIDPLNRSEEAIMSNLQNKWLLPDLAKGEAFPSVTLCHGFVHTVEWDTKRIYRLPNLRADVNIGVGNTSIEAKAAQLARQTGAAEKLLSAYIYDILKDIENVAEIETQVDDRAFSQVDGGTLWEIRRTDAEDAKANEQTEKRPAFPDEATNPGLSSAFRKLNPEQRKMDRLKEARMSLFVEFRALSDKLIKDEEERRSVLQQELSTKREAIKKDIVAFDTDIAASELLISGYLAEINSKDAFKKKYKDGAEVPPEFELVNKKMPRFWRPNDPTLVFSGPGGSTSTKYKSQEANGKLLCRFPAGITAGLILNDDGPVDKIASPAGISLGLVAVGSLNDERIDIINRLFFESLLLDPNWSAEWAYQYYKERTRPDVSAERLGQYLANVLNLVKDVPTAKFKGLKSVDGKVSFDNTKDNIGLVKFFEQVAAQKWSHPWTPVYLLWNANWTPEYTVQNGNWQFKQDSWEWKDKRYRYKGVFSTRNKFIEYSGKVILSDTVTGMLQSRLPEGLKIGQNISQSIGSFSDALLMRKHSVQLPLYRKPDASRKLFRDTSNDAFLTNETYFFPNTDARLEDPKNFFPVRAGHLQFIRLWITDAFGQLQRVINFESSKVVVRGPVYVAENLKNNIDPKKESDVDPNMIMLSPRIVQPSRLLFRWTDAKSDTLEESSSDPKTSPVCGWLLPDYLSQSLNIYEASGTCCGSLRMISDSAFPASLRLEWGIPPGVVSENTPEKSIKNKYLLSFVLGVLNFKDDQNVAAGGHALALIFELCRNMSVFLNSASSHQAPGIAGLMGQPVALVRAALKLELSGLPAQPQGWTDTITEDSKKNPPGLTGFEFPVSLGDTRNSKDGLIGYFSDKTGFGKLNVAYGTPAQTSRYFSREDVKLAFAPDAAPLGVTLLMDARGGVQADCGLLPSKFIDLPNIFIETGLKNLELNLLVAPFLGAPVNPFLPVGVESDSAWTLLQKTNLGAWITSDQGGQDQLQTNRFNEQKVHEGYLTLRPGATKQG